METRLEKLSAVGVLSLALASALLQGCAGGSRELEQVCETTKPPLEAGQKVGELELENLAGRPEAISTIIGGKVALVDVWATWCQPCLLAIPHLSKLHAQYEDRGFTVVGVMVDQNAGEIGPEFVAKRGIEYPVLLDDDGNRFMCEWGEFFGIPLLYLIDSDGTVLDVFSGVGDLTAIDRRIEQLYGEPVEGGADRLL